MDYLSLYYDFLGDYYKELTIFFVLCSLLFFSYRVMTIPSFEDELEYLNERNERIIFLILGTLCVVFFWSLLIPVLLIFCLIRGYLSLLGKCENDI
jgi:hypothetical protein